MSICSVISVVCVPNNVLEVSELDTLHFGLGFTSSSCLASEHASNFKETGGRCGCSAAWGRVLALGWLMVDLESKPEDLRFDRCGL